MTQNFKIIMPKIFRISVFFNSCALLVMPRLNSEDFSKFLLCLDILFLTYSPVRAHLEVQKTAEIISYILEYS